MSARRGFFYRQLVAASDITQAYDDLEAADREVVSDLGFAGALTGLVASQHGAGGYTVDVTGGVAYDQLGQRIYVPSTQNVDVSVDHLGVSTNVAGFGNSKVISLFVKFNRALANPKTDGNGVTVYYDRLESYAWYVKQGAEATTGSQVPPPKESDGILVANITLAYSVSAQVILTAAISATTRDDLVVISGTPLAIRRGSYYSAVSDIVAQLNAITAGSVPVPASAVTYAGGGSWAGGTSPTNPATDVGSQLTKIVADLSSLTNGASGADRIGVETLVGVSSTVSAGTLFHALSALKNAGTIDKGAATNWADGTTNPAATLQSFVNSIIAALASQLSSSGAAKVGFYGAGGLVTGNVQAALAQLVSTTAAADGALVIGAEVKGSFTTNTVRGQLDELDTTRSKLAAANHFTAACTFDNLAMTAGHSVGLSSRSVTRMLGQVPNPAIVAPGNNTTLFFSLPNGVVLNTVTANIVPTAHGAWPPATKSSIVVEAWSGTTGVPGGPLGLASDSAGTLVAGNANRGISTGAIGVTVDRTTTPFFSVTFAGESGANSTSTQIASIAVTCTVTGLDDLPVD